MKKLKKTSMNVFTVLVIAASLSLFFRAINIVTAGKGDAEAISAASAVQDPSKPALTNEEPPPLTNEQIKKSIQDTAQQLDNPGKAGATKAAAEAAVNAAENKTEASEGKDSIQLPKGPEAESGTEGEKADAGNPADTSDDDRSFSKSEIEVLQSLSKRRDGLDAREKQLQAREALIAAAESEVGRKVDELNKLRSEIEALLGKQQKMEEDRIVSLVKIYEGMKPKEAANIFNTLDMDILLTVIGRMNERKSSPILAAMDPEKARAVTIKLAEQRKLPGLPKADKTEAAPKPAAPPPAPAAPADETAP